MGNIVWLASYPKSGNTWVRVFLTNYLRNNDTPASINNLDTGWAASARELLDPTIGAECSDLTDEEINRFRPDAYRVLATLRAGTSYLKVHDAYLMNTEGRPVFPPDVSRGVIYLVRNPLDVAISFAHHSAKTIDRTIADMNEPSRVMDADPSRLRDHVPQQLLSWSGHASSWLDQRDIPVLLMRYEDMSAEPYETFLAAVRFLGLPEDEPRIRRAIDFSSFGRLRNEELSRGFQERSPHAGSFFRQGKPGAWQGVLTDAQIARVLENHGPMMTRLGYVGGDR